MDFAKYQYFQKELERLNQEIQNNPTSETFEQYKEAQEYIYNFDSIEKLKSQKEANTRLYGGEFDNLAREENQRINKKIKEIEDKYSPKNQEDKKSIIMEIRPGTGGDEAALFAKEIYDMYITFATYKNWKIKNIEININQSGGLRLAILSIEGYGVYKYLKYESGVHRVQRIPKTESSGRIHTSTISIVVMPKVSNKEVNIKNEDLRIDVFRASGAGGQHINKTESAVRIKHLPTGITVSCQETRSQIQNRELALEILRSKIYEQQKEQRERETSNIRKEQIADSKRSEKIRTYNFPQDRITDHRIQKSFFGISSVMEKNFEEIIEELIKSENN